MAHIPKQLTVVGETNRVAAVPAKGFYVEPLTNERTGNPVRFPLTVRFNGDASTDLVVADGRARYLQSGTMDVVGGTVGDRWRITFLETDADGIGGGVPRDAGSLVLAAKTTWALEEYTYGARYWVPGANGQVTTVVMGTEPEATLDVGEFTHLALLVDNRHLVVDPVTGTRPDLFVYLSPALGEVAPRSIGEVSIRVPAGRTGFILLGPGQAGTPGFDGGDWVKVLNQRFPWVRVSYMFNDYTAGATPQPGNHASVIRLVGMR